jgi:hypothetical protein
VSGSAVQDISAAHSTLVESFVNRLQAMRSAKQFQLPYIWGKYAVSTVSTTVTSF